MTLGNAAAARVRLIVWCLDCRRQVEPDPTEMAQRYGAEKTALAWKDRLTCLHRGSREIETKWRYIRQCHRAGCGRGKSSAPGTANRIASAKSSPVVKSSALACSPNSREMVIVTFA